MSAPRVFTPEERQAIKRAYCEDGLSTQQLSKLYDCWPVTMWRLIKSFNVPMRAQRGGRPPKISPGDEPVVVEAYLRGVSVKDLARQYGVSRTAIYSALRRRNATRPRGQPYKIPQGSWPDVVAAYRGGQTAKQIARQYDCDERTVYEVLRRLGVTLRRGNPRRYYHALTPTQREDYKLFRRKRLSRDEALRVLGREDLI